ncbi:hypothetical protein DND67_17580 [Pseudomonas syringae pv. pisi]|nr:hypothetical protein DND67_17580 [Pseudomonas syringae pv. pisi]
MQFLITPSRNKGLILQMLPRSAHNIIRSELTITNQVCDWPNSAFQYRHGETSSCPWETAFARDFRHQVVSGTKGFTLSRVEFDGKHW